jgi:ureidoglycolate lyase
MPALIARPLVADEFAPFGDILSFDRTTARVVNNGNALRSDMPGRLEFSLGEPRLALYRVEAKHLPISVAEWECHPNSSQAFFPLTARRYLVVVAPQAADGSPDGGRCQAFIGERGQGFVYRPGVWHAAIVALEEGGDFLMLIWEQGAAADCHTERLSHPIQIISASN